MRKIKGNEEEAECELYENGLVGREKMGTRIVSVWIKGRINYCLESVYHLFHLSIVFFFNTP